MTRVSGWLLLPGRGQASTTRKHLGGTSHDPARARRYPQAPPGLSRIRQHLCRIQVEHYETIKSDHYQTVRM